MVGVAELESEITEKYFRVDISIVRTAKTVHNLCRKLRLLRNIEEYFDYCGVELSKFYAIIIFSGLGIFNLLGKSHWVI